MIVSVVFAALATTSAATAASPADEATAEALFQEGKRLATAGDFARACPKFAESQRLAPGSGTLLNLADCLEKVGKYASAWAAFKDAEVGARAKGNKEREAEASRRAAALAPRLPKLTLVVPPAAKVPGFELRRDGSVVGEAQWGSALPVDQGHHEIVASAAGYKTWSTSVRIDTDGGAASVEVPPLEKAPASGGSAQRTAGYVALGVGGAGLVVGAITLGLDAAKHSSLVSQCGGNSCPASFAGDVSTYHVLGVVSSTSLAVGGAVAVTGLVLTLTAPSAKPAGVAVLPIAGPRFIGIAGRFQ